MTDQRKNDQVLIKVAAENNHQHLKSLNIRMRKTVAMDDLNCCPDATLQLRSRFISFQKGISQKKTSVFFLLKNRHIYLIYC